MAAVAAAAGNWIDGCWFMSAIYQFVLKFVTSRPAKTGTLCTHSTRQQAFSRVHTANIILASKRKDNRITQSKKQT